MGTFVDSSFTGKEKDEETGYSYFGARYYDADLLTGWMSVDPMSDKYPSISPYAYCAWNPVKLVDPDGRKIRYSSLGDWMIVLVARCVSQDFNSKHKILKSSDETYIYHGVSEYELKDGLGGEFTTDGNTLFINYRLKGKESQGDNCFVNLLHETEHAMQFEHGELGFVNINGEWLGSTESFDILDEYKAREAGYSWPIYLSDDPTSTSIRELWVSNNTEYNIALLKNSNNYADLSEGSLINKNTERIQDEKRFALPYKDR